MGKDFEIIGMYINTVKDKVGIEFNVKFENLVITFDDKYKIIYDEEKNVISVSVVEKKCEEPFYSSRIKSLSAIVGQNGVGKSTILNLLANPKFDHRMDCCIIYKIDEEFFVDDPKSILSDSNETNTINCKNDFGKLYPNFNTMDKSKMIYFTHFVKSIDRRVHPIYDSNVSYIMSKNVADTSISTPDQYISLLNLLYDTENPTINKFITSNYKRKVYVSNEFSNEKNSGFESKDLKRRAENDIDEIFSELHMSIKKETLGSDIILFHKITDNKERFIILYLYNILKQRYFAYLKQEEKRETDVNSQYDSDYIKNEIDLKLSHGSKNNIHEFRFIKNTLLDKLLEIKKKISSEIYEYYSFDKEQSIIESIIEKFEQLSPELYKSYGLTLYDIECESKINNQCIDFLKTLTFNDSDDDDTIVRSQLWKDLKPKSPFFSSGEEKIASMFSCINDEFNNSELDIRTFILLIDEPDSQLHPEWSRIFLDNLIKMLEMYGEHKEVKFQVIFTTHSPFLLSDVLSDDVIKLKFEEKNENIVKVANENNHLSKTFAGNIHDLMNESFFLTSSIGQFAVNKINNEFKILDEDGKKIDYENLKFIAGEVGDEFISGYLYRKIEESEIKNISNFEKNEKIRYYKKIIEELENK